MKLFIHVLNTWLLAHLLHPFIWVIYFFSVGTGTISIGEGGFFILVLIFSVFLSIPALFVVWPLLYLINKGPFSPNDKIFLWVVAIQLTLFLSFSIFLFLGSGRIKWQEIEFILPAALSALSSVLLRKKAFMDLQTIYSTNTI